MELIELTVTEEFEMARLDQFLAGHLLSPEPISKS